MCPGCNRTNMHSFTILAYLCFVAQCVASTPSTSFTLFVPDNVIDECMYGCSTSVFFRTERLSNPLSISLDHNQDTKLTFTIPYEVGYLTVKTRNSRDEEVDWNETFCSECKTKMLAETFEEYNEYSIVYRGPFALTNYLYTNGTCDGNRSCSDCAKKSYNGLYALSFLQENIEEETWLQGTMSLAISDNVWSCDGPIKCLEVPNCMSFEKNKVYSLHFTTSFREPDTEGALWKRPNYKNGISLMIIRGLQFVLTDKKLGIQKDGGWIQNTITSITWCFTEDEQGIRIVPCPKSKSGTLETIILFVNVITNVIVGGMLSLISLKM